jgi:CubicO group peptidase (beta-lactamase class C family)
MMQMCRELVLSILFSSQVMAGGRQGGNAGIWPANQWALARPEEVGMDPCTLAKARDYALTGQGSGMIVRYGRNVCQWGDQQRLYDVKSSTKGMGITALGLALADGKIESLQDAAVKYHPTLGIPPESNAETGWLDKITIFHLATQTAGFDKPGGYNELLFEPGTKWSYTDAGPNWLAECITLAYGRDLNELMFERVFGPIGIEPFDLKWRKNRYRPEEIEGIARREFGAGFIANVDAMARIGYLYLRRGFWGDKSLMPEWFVDAVRTVPGQIKGLPVLKPEIYFNAPNHYGLLWWNNADGEMPNVPKDVYWTWGMYDSLIVVIPSLDIVAVRAGNSFDKKRDTAYAAITPFISPIAESVREGRPPYPPSPVIKGIAWADADTVIRKAKGSDNWPLTWGDDDNLYTAYGDGWGFEPKVDKKLSLGLAKIKGSPPDFQGINIRSKTGERLGQGAAGTKASGMLMVDGILYMLVRNTGNSQIAFSKDHGKTWEWCDWKFTTSFGCPIFINYGRNYEGAPGDYVYIVSPDSATAYIPADRMVMARTPKDSVTEEDAYEFFAKFDAAGNPVWTKNIDGRGAVFTNIAKCYRSGLTYNAAIKRYLWCQIIPGPDTRFEGGFAIYDAPAPWGPWTKAYFAERWDIAPGETASFPTKWMGPDGKTLYMTFSGEDAFSIRKAELILAN